MKTSESVTKISAALLKAQRAITFAAKDATNPHFKNKYADLPAVIDAIKPALNEAGIMFMQTPSPSDSGSLALTTRLLHESGEWMEDTATVPLPKNDPQGYGSAMTYARRYSLAAMTGLYQDDDDGVAAMKPKAEPPKAEPLLSLDQITAIKDAANESGVTVDQICKAGKVRDIADIHAASFTKLVTWIISQKKEAA